MQKLIAQIKQHPSWTEPEKWNFCREYLQVVILKSAFETAIGRALVFQGGTCLRICHELKRYSEDLDFSLVERPAGYSFRKLHTTILRDLSREGFEVSGSVSEDKIVQKAFIRVAGLPAQFGLTLPAAQKLAIKVEVDVRPPENGRRESYFVSRFGELFPILKYDLPTLFAGKALAILCRPYQRGRDYYDLIWFLTQRLQGNMDYFVSGMKQAKSASRARIASLKAWTDVLREIARKVEEVKPADLLKDLRPFLEDPTDQAWIENYRQVFHQLFSDYQTNPGSK
jgi:predicted nucleotidyltransferase component of viral defense system